jgi:glycosyltransferase involved in cell wall biosynthesis
MIPDMSTSSLVSVITVCFNSEKTIARTIESVLGQTYKNFEYLIVDGMSTDGTIDIVKQYESKFEGRMRWISEKDGGVYDAMNKGINLATGTIIGIINSDDWYEPDALARVMQEHEKKGEGVFYGMLRYWSAGKEKMIRTLHHEFLPQDTLPHPTCFISRSLYKELGGYRQEYVYAADYELLLRFYASKKVTFVLINAVLANFTDGGMSTHYLDQTLKETYSIQYRYGYISRKIWIVKMLKKNIAILLRKMKLINE